MPHTHAVTQRRAWPTAYGRLAHRKSAHTPHNGPAAIGPCHLCARLRVDSTTNKRRAATGLDPKYHSACARQGAGEHPRGRPQRGFEKGDHSDSEEEDGERTERRGALPPAPQLPLQM
eukprot:scaffold23434_cov135-Isochrysis_galbana.AAC.1